jgi:hypothetical protein
MKPRDARSIPAMALLSSASSSSYSSFSSAPREAMPAMLRPTAAIAWYETGVGLPLSRSGMAVVTVERCRSGAGSGG